MIKVKKGQDPYSVIGQYIRDHVLAIEDMIAVIEIDGRISNQLFTVDMTVDGYFIWEGDWYEGEENVVLIDFFPVSDACNPKNHWIPCSEKLPEEDTEVLISYRYKEGEGDTDHVNIDITSYGTTCFGGREIHTLKEWRQPFDYFHANYEVTAWMPLPEPWKGDKE